MQLNQLPQPSWSAKAFGRKPIEENQHMTKNRDAKSERAPLQPKVCNENVITRPKKSLAVKNETENYHVCSSIYTHESSSLLKLQDFEDLPNATSTPARSKKCQTFDVDHSTPPRKRRHRSVKFNTVQVEDQSAHNIDTVSSAFQKKTKHSSSPLSERKKLLRDLSYSEFLLFSTGSGDLI